MAESLPFTLQNNEEVLLLARRHWSFFAWQITKDAVAALVPAAVLLTIVQLTAGLGGTGGLVAWLIAAAWLAFWAVKGYFAWYTYHHDIWVVTNQRVVDSLKKNWFHHRMASTDLVNVEDMAVNRSGLIGTLFNFGELQMQTAGEKENFVLDGIPNPARVLALIDAQRDRARRELYRTGA